MVLWPAGRWASDCASGSRSRQSLPRSCGPVSDRGAVSTAFGGLVRARPDLQGGMMGAIERRAHVAELRKQGMSWAEIGKAMGISRQRAAQLYDRWLVAPAGGRKPGKIQQHAATIRELAAEGKHVGEIGRALAVEVNRLGYFCRRSGIALPPKPGPLASEHGDLIRELAGAGSHVRDISAATGLSVKQLYGFCERNGLKLTRAPGAGRPRKVRP